MFYFSLPELLTVHMHLKLIACFSLMGVGVGIFITNSGWNDQLIPIN